MPKGLILNVDTTKSEFQNPMVELRQGDGNYQSLYVTVTDNGDPFDLTGWTVSFMGTTAGSHKIIDANVVLDSTVVGAFTYTPTKAWGQDEGEFKNAYFKFVKSDETASGASFRVNVLNAVDLTDEEAQAYISVVDAMIDTVKTDMDSKLADTQKTLTDTQDTANTVQTNVDELNTNVNQLKSQNNNLLTSDNIWSGNNTFSEPLSATIASRILNNGTDLYTLIEPGILWYTNTQSNGASMINKPFANQTAYSIETINISGYAKNSWATTLLVFRDALNNRFNSILSSDGTGKITVVKQWSKVPVSDNDLVHKTGSETIYGNKTFNGTTSIKNTDLSYTPAQLSYYTRRITPAQDMTVIDDYLLIFDGTTTDHSVVQTIQTKVLSAGYASTGALVAYTGTAKTHNLGHVNGVDYINGQLPEYASSDLNNGYLVAYNGSGLPPEVSLFDNVNKNTTFFDVKNSTNIVFKEYTKTLDGDGSVSFGGDYQTILMTRIVDAKTVGIRVIKLGTGSNDYSDATSDHSDLTSWGSFVSGKTDFQYNGTAKIVNDIMLDTSSINAVSNQPQGQTYKGNSLFMGIGFNNSNIIEVKIFSNYAKIVNNFFPPSYISSGSVGEMEGVAIHEGELIGLSSALLYKIKLYGNSNSVKKYGDQTISGNNTFTGNNSFSILYSNSGDINQVVHTKTITVNGATINYMRAGNVVFGRITGATVQTYTLSGNDGYKAPSDFVIDFIGPSIKGWFSSNQMRIDAAGQGNFLYITRDDMPTS